MVQKMVITVIGIFIFILIAVALLPSLADQAVGAVAVGGNVSVPTNVTGGSAALTNILVLLFVVIVIIAVLGTFGIIKFTKGFR